jgi:hypothetical protein
MYKKSATLTAIPESGVSGGSISVEENLNPHRRINLTQPAREGFRVAISPNFRSVIHIWPFSRTSFWLTAHFIRAGNICKFLSLHLPSHTAPKAAFPMGSPFVTLSADKLTANPLLHTPIIS